MVDFKKKLSRAKVEKPIDPLKLYETLDRAHDKGPLRPPQVAVLSAWYEHHRSQRDVIVKLHTGQGKTLIGLLILQSQLNAGKGPALYLCPDNFLIGQTCEQARQFGIKTCTVDDELPQEFLGGQTMLLTSVQKLFNGLTKFGLNRQSISVDSILMDDAHACADRIREACKLRIPGDDPAYSALIALFGSDLEQQGVGTFADLVNAKREALLPVPYWAWIERESDVARILASGTDRKCIKFGWPLLKDMLAHCQCIFSGAAVEIEPYVAPLAVFGSYSKAQHRIFMSATVTDDSFLVKGLQLKPDTIVGPLTYAKETWSGEKMILIPSLINDELDRTYIVNYLGKANTRRGYGVVALSPSFNKTTDWSTLGAVVADKDTVWDAISALKSGQYSQAVVLVNRYDGIDLPDDTCRILVFDSKPFSENLSDLHQERCRPDSDATHMRTIRTVEQGMGRSVRGDKDYSVVIAIGADLVRLLRDNSSRKHLSPQMGAQIKIGLSLSDMAMQDVEEGKTPQDAFWGLAKQCLRRDDGWKAYYAQEMDKVTPTVASKAVLKIYEAELEAEQFSMGGDYSGARDRLQGLIDEKLIANEDRGWYLQESARFLYRFDRAESQRMQVAAHKLNRLLLKPPVGVTVAKLTVVSQGRAERIIEWVRQFQTYADLDATVTDILGRLVFGTKAERFEAALDELSRALGFAGERPDAEWKEGPDNLWALDDKQYLLFECKSEVDIKRSEINKREAEQMNRSCAWFQKHYGKASVKNLIVHPAGKIESAAAFTHPVDGMREPDLRRFAKSVRDFFKSFESQRFSDLSPVQIQKSINAHKLAVEDLIQAYSRKLKDMK